MIAIPLWSSLPTPVRVWIVVCGVALAIIGIALINTRRVERRQLREEFRQWDESLESAE